jgi:hypothetical protein
MFCMHPSSHTDVRLAVEPSATASRCPPGR